MADNKGPTPAKEQLNKAKSAKADATDAEVVKNEPPAKGAPASGKPEAKDAKPGDTKPAAGKPAETKAEGSGSAPARSGEVKPAIAAGSTKSAEPAKPASASDTKPAASKPDAAKADTDKKPSGFMSQKQAESSTPPKAAEPPRKEPEADHMDDMHDEPERRSLSGIILQWLVIFFIGAGAALWGGPKLAPHLPEWAAPAAKFLTPGANQNDEALAALRSEAEAGIAALTSRIDALEAGAPELATSAAGEAAAAVEADLTARIEEINAAIAAQSDEIAAQAENAGAMEALDALAGRVASLETTLAGELSSGDEEALKRLGSEIEALRAAAGGIDQLATADSVATVSSNVASISDNLAAIGTRVTEVDTRLTALENGQAATAGAKSEAEQILRDANLRSALTRISDSLLSGAPYEQAINDAVSLSGQTAPEALTALSETGAPTAGSLMQGFPEAARKGYAADKEANAGDSFGEKLFASLSGKIGGRPATETEGDDVGAVLSRIEARLKEGRITAAAAEAEALPPASAEAMGAWLESLNKSAAATGGFEDWRTTLGAN